MKSLLVALTLLLAGCGTTVSSVPIYPADWPALSKANDPKAPDISGTYYALSDPVGPLVYPKGGAPHEIFFLIPIGGPPDTPQLGRRILPWHLGVRPSNELWNSVCCFDAAIQSDSTQSGVTNDRGWVRITRADGGKFTIQCGQGEVPSVSFVLAPATPQSFFEFIWTNPDGYTIEDGALVVFSVVTTSRIEHGFDSKGIGDASYYGDAAGCFRFWRALDGSLIMLENLTGERYKPGRGSLVFQKWWRWRPIPAGR